MSIARLLTVILAGFSLTTAVLVGAAPGSKPDYVVYVWDEIVYAQSLQGGTVRDLGRRFADFETLLPPERPDLYTLSDSPLLEIIEPGWGFHHGVWSRDRRQMVYLEVEHLSPNFRLKLLTEDGSTRLLLEDAVSAARGYLDPLGWTDDGGILLLERYSLHTLTDLRVWRLDTDTLEVDVVYRSSTRPLKGRSAVTTNGTGAFIGLTPELQVGFSFDFDKLQVFQFAAPTAFSVEPASVFEMFPVEVLGIVPGNQFNAFAAEVAAEAPADPDETVTLPEPWLYWPVADDIRFITCLPDSTRTGELYVYVCPGLERDYPGHEGTDISYRPGGLPLGSDIYPAAPGVVIETFTACIDETPSCHGAYGNTILLEHTLVSGGETSTWYTGYGHLEFVMVEPSSYIADRGTTIALSGDSGVGGPHLHFEVRYPHGGGTRWVDPWDVRHSSDGRNLWVGSNDTPTSAATFAPEVPVETLCTVTSDAGNNIRRGPGTIFDKLGETRLDENYAVTAIISNEVGQARGEWYRVLYNEGTSEGWLWSGLVSTCER